MLCTVPAVLSYHEPLDQYQASGDASEHIAQGANVLEVLLNSIPQKAKQWDASVHTNCHGAGTCMPPDPACPIAVVAVAHSTLFSTGAFLLADGNAHLPGQSLGRRLCLRLIHANMRLIEAALGEATAIQYELAHHLPTVIADEVQLRQVLMNLVINSSEAIGEQDGIITITTATRHLPAEELVLYRFGNERASGISLAGLRYRNWHGYNHPPAHL